MLKAIAKLIDFITWMICFSLTARFIMRFFGARTDAPFVEWLYSTTDNFMTPFIGIFPNLRLARGNLVDISAIVAAVVLGIIGYAISAFLDSIADHLAYKPTMAKPMASPNPTAPSVVNHQSINEPVGLKKE